MALALPDEDAGAGAPPPHPLEANTRQTSALTTGADVTGYHEIKVAVIRKDAKNLKIRARPADDARQCARAELRLIAWCRGCER